ncbi:MAG: hypothetical protein QM747_01580 [Nocardioides sp.]
MSLGDALLTFVSVFVAALLAFYLDGLRERRATRGWVREYLGFWRGFMASRGDEEQQNATGVHQIEDALAGWLTARTPEEVTWAHIDTMNVNATVRFTQHLLNESASLLPAELMNDLYVADATAPMLTARGQYVTRIFEAEIRPLVLDREVPLDGRDRRAVELYSGEFTALFQQLQAYTDHMRKIQGELTRLGF